MTYGRVADMRMSGASIGEIAERLHISRVEVLHILENLRLITDAVGGRCDRAPPEVEHEVLP